MAGRCCMCVVGVILWLYLYTSPLMAATVEHRIPTTTSPHLATPNFQTATPNSHPATATSTQRTTREHATETSTPRPTQERDIDTSTDRHTQEHTIDTFIPKPTKVHATDTSTKRPTQEHTKDTSTPRPTQEYTMDTSNPRPTREYPMDTSTPRPTRERTMDTSTRRPTRVRTTDTSTQRPTRERTMDTSTQRPTRGRATKPTKRPTSDPGTSRPTRKPKHRSIYGHPEIVRLSSAVDFMMKKLKHLEKDRDFDREEMRELERRSLENNEDAIRALAGNIELQYRVSEIQNRLTQLEENVDSYRYHMENMRLDQEQIKTELTVYKKLKDSTRRSFRKLDKHLSKYSLRMETLENEIKNVSSAVNNVRDTCSDEIRVNMEKVDSLEELIENRTKPFFEGNFRHIKTRMNKLNTNLTFPNSAIQLATNEDGSGDIETDYILTPLQESSNHIETGSGDEPIKEIPVGLLPHTHPYYLNTEDFILEMQERDEDITQLEKLYDQLKGNLQTVESRLASIQLGEFMGKLQESLLNFTQNVITIDQWKMASTDIVNSTQVNQHQIASLTNMILNNSNHVRDVEWKIADVQTLGYQQFNLLRMYVIQLNNSVQDMKETMSHWRKKAPQHHNLNNHQSSRLPAENRPPPNVEHLETVKSRIEDLALQIIYNENRISKLEIRALNESLFECKKYSTDFDQDAKIHQIKQEMSKLIEAEVMVKEMLKRLDRGLFRVYLTNTNQSDAIRDIVREVESLSANVTVLDEIKQEVDHVRFMLPRDCEEYYRRGHRQSGLYVIQLTNATRSLKVSCDMEDGLGGWTVIQRRYNGREVFARGWQDYKAGFGSSDGEYWLGNDLIHSLTHTKKVSLKIDMVDTEDVYWTVTYSNFSIRDEDTKYKLTVDGYYGNATDSLTYANGMGFSTQDQDNDGSSTNCAVYYTAGWWYKHCLYSNLNGRYKLGMVWYNYNKGKWIELTQSTMKIKPVSV